MRPINDITGDIIGAAIEVHRHLGPGLLESTYQACLCQELTIRNIPFEKQLALPVIYKGMHLDAGYRIDLLVENQVILELKSIEALAPIHFAQLLTYLRLTERRVGLLINFNMVVLKDGVKRLINDPVAA
ncbi:GxxExxY protein [Anatilimnocola floriformis]|uniref:GxxExxY protein n=1 Tax=Anatilimnocola floriformis TaxID=2948575 RepID=UPI0020C5B274|nr:GxxExxY protein [Anatilimnocola floriformis]